MVGKVKVAPVKFSQSRNLLVILEHLIPAIIFHVAPQGRTKCSISSMTTSSLSLH
jgi:hypothetical protein